ncbi:MAG: GyrI-like domain-containing protein [Eubacteriales bacterium]|nr:GyrI-like domain-containing protein [Eubacteriales bacterium]
MNYEIIELEEFNVIGIRYELSKSLSNNIKLAQNHWKDFNNKLRQNKLYLGSNWCKYAFTLKFENNIYYYISISKKSYIPDGFTEKLILKGKYLKVNHIGNMNKLKDTVNYIYKEIIPKNNILVENEQFIYFEKYDYKFHWNREDSIIEIYVPIK